MPERSEGEDAVGGVAAARPVRRGKRSAAEIAVSFRRGEVAVLRALDAYCAGTGRARSSVVKDLVRAFLREDEAAFARLVRAARLRRRLLGMPRPRIPADAPDAS